MGKNSLLVWIFQTGEPLHIDGANARPMRAMNLSNALVEAGHRVILWSSAFYHQEKRHRSMRAQNIRVSDNLEIRLIPSRGYQRHIGLERLIDHAEMAFNLKNGLRHEENLPDVAFIGYPPIETAAVLVRWLAQRGVPTLLDVKDQWPSLFLEKFPLYLHPIGRVILWPYFYLAKRAMRNATGLSAMANSFLDWAVKFAGHSRREMDGVFPLTSPADQVTASQLDNARRWWDHQGIKDDGQPRACFIGSHSPAFDFKPVYEAAKMTVNGTITCQFVVCGDGECSAQLREMMARMTNVHFPGWVNRPKIEALAERCKVALAPYHNKEDFCMSLPNKIIDALSLGLPILSPLQGEVASLIDENGVGMRYGTDTGKTLYDCIQTVINNRELQQKMSYNARSLYNEKFSFERVYGGLVKHLEILAQKSTVQRYVYYSAIPDSCKIPKIILKAGYHLKIWTPSLLSIAPKELITPVFIAWWLCYWLKIFKNLHYKIYLVYTSEKQLAHYTVLLPAHFRFPFMHKTDLQIGPLGTYNSHRRNDLAHYVLYKILNDYKNSGKRLWYVARKENEPSIRLIEKMKFAKVGEGIKIKRFFAKLLTIFYITKRCI